MKAAKQRLAGSTIAHTIAAKRWWQQLRSLCNASLRRTIPALIITAALAPSALCADSTLPIATETEIKAVYTLNFIRFTEWPSSVVDRNNKQIRLAILGNLQLLKTFKSDALQQKAQQIKLQTISCVMPTCIRESHALFIDASQANSLPRLLNSLRNKAILTISDIPGFAEAGGMIELRNIKGRMALRINLQAIRQANLYVSAELLQLAEIIGEKQ